MMEERIAAYLAHRMPQAQGIKVSGLMRIPGGASRETWSFDAHWQEGGKEVKRGFIIRRDPDASLLETERDLEFQVYQALQPTPVPVPKPYWVEKDTQWLERPFFVMERIDGCETAPQVLALDPRYDGVREKIARRKVQILAEIHKLDWRALGLEFLGVPESPAHCGPMEIEKWERVLAEQELEPQPVLWAAFRWLRKHLPPPAQKITIVHADYRTGNFLYNQQGEIRAMLDWEMVHLGDPLEDVAWVAIRPWRFAGDDRVGGLLDREEFFRLYEEYSGLKVDRQAIHFWEVLGVVKLAVILLTGGRSFCDGRTRRIQMAMVGVNTAGLDTTIMELIGV